MSESNIERVAIKFLTEIDQLITDGDPEAIRLRIGELVSGYNRLGFREILLPGELTPENVASAMRDEVKAVLAAFKKDRIIRSITALEGIRYDFLNPKCDLNALIATYNDLDLGLFSREALEKCDPEAIKSAFKKQVNEEFRQLRKERLRILIAEVKSMLVSFDESRDYQGLYRAFEESGCAQLKQGTFAWNYEGVKSAIEKELRMMEEAYEKLNAPSEPPPADKQ
jgi:hypothetical protein